MPSLVTAPPGPTREHHPCTWLASLSDCLSHGEFLLRPLDPPSTSLLLKACVASLSDQFKAPGVTASHGPGCGHQEECGSRKPPASQHFSSSELGTAGGRVEWGWGEPAQASPAGPGWAGLTPPQSGAGPQEEPGSRAAGEHQTVERRYGRNESRGPLLPADQETSRGEFGPQSHCTNS